MPWPARGCAYDLSAAFAKAVREKRTVTRAGVKVETGGGAQVCGRRDRANPGAGGAAGHGHGGVHGRRGPEAKPPGKRLQTGTSPAALARMEQELRQARDELQTTREQMQTSQEELRSANEEMQSANEELQSTTRS